MYEIINVFGSSIWFFLMLHSFIQDIYILNDQLLVLIITLSDNPMTWGFQYLYSFILILQKN